MQTKAQLESAVEASLRHARNKCMLIEHFLSDLATGEPLQKLMPTLRVHLQDLTKAIHEYNAYRNALETGL